MSLCAHVVMTWLVVGTPQHATPFWVGFEIHGGPANLDGFLESRTLAAWDGVQLMRTAVDRDIPRERTFRVAMQWWSATQVSVVITLDERTLVERTVELEESLQAKLMLWLLVKSTIDRGLAQVPAATPAPAVSLPNARREADAARANAGELAAVAEERTPPVAIKKAEPRIEEPEARAPQTVPASFAWGVLTQLWLETPRLVAFGLLATCAYYWQFVSIAAEAGYRFTPGPDGLSVHALPLVGRAGLHYGTDVSVAAGALLSAEAKFGVSAGRAVPTAGSEAGAYFAARLRLVSDWYAVLRLTVAWRLARVRYIYFDSLGRYRETREQPWSSMVGTGLEWR
jgi:hypothetical protein